MRELSESNNYLMASYTATFLKMIDTLQIVYRDIINMHSDLVISFEVS